MTGAPVLQRERRDHRRRGRRAVEEIDVDRVAALDVLIDEDRRRPGPPAACRITRRMVPCR